MDYVYLITVPSENQNGKPLQFVVSDVSIVTGKYPFFMIQKVDFIKE